MSMDQKTRFKFAAQFANRGSFNKRYYSSIVIKNETLTFKEVGDTAIDIGWGGDTLWRIGSNNGIYRFNGRKGYNLWDKMLGKAKRVDVDNKGRAWVVNMHGNVFFFDSKFDDDTRTESYNWT